MVRTPKERNLRDIFDEVVRERMRQDEKWGGPKHDDEHSPADWRRFIIEHTVRAQSVRQDVGRGGLAIVDETFVVEMIRVAALAMAAIQAYERTAIRNLPKVKRDRVPQ